MVGRDPLLCYTPKCPYCGGILEFIGGSESEFGTGEEYWYECEDCGVEVEYTEIKEAKHD
jgi:tRNA(Ile2) C34 agmatinyltransferase TiaS